MRETKQISADKEIIRLMKLRGLRGLQGQDFSKAERRQGTRVLQAVGTAVAEASRGAGIGMFYILKGGQSEGSRTNRVRETGSEPII